MCTASPGPTLCCRPPTSSRPDPLRNTTASSTSCVCRECRAPGFSQPRMSDTPLDPVMKETPRPSIWSQLDTRRDEKFSLYARYVNAAEVRSVRRLGADLEYVKGQGSYLYDQNGGRYLDCDSGSGVFALGRNHARMRLAMHELLDLDLLSLASRDTPLLAGLLAE